MSDGSEQSARGQTFAPLIRGALDSYSNTHRLGPNERNLLRHLLESADFRTGVVAAFSWVGLARSINPGAQSTRRSIECWLKRLAAVGALRYTSPGRGPSNPGCIQVLVYEDLVHRPNRLSNSAANRAPNARMTDAQSRGDRANERPGIARQARESSRADRAIPSAMLQVRGQIHGLKKTYEEEPPTAKKSREQQSVDIDMATDVLRATIVHRHGSFLDGAPARKLRRLVETHGTAVLLDALATAPRHLGPPKVVDHLAVAVLDPLELSTPSAAQALDHSDCPLCGGSCWVYPEGDGVDDGSVVQCPSWLDQRDAADRARRKSRLEVIA